MSTTPQLERTIDGVEVPAAGLWTIDPGHAEVAFIGRHFMLTKVRGRFTGLEGRIEVGEQLDDSTVDVRIDVASIDSGDQTRDDHLRSDDLFDVDRHPEATFRSTRVQIDGSSGSMIGDLTIRGVTRTVALDIRYIGAVRDPWGYDRAVFSAKGRVARADWGLTWNMALDNGGLLVSKEVDIEIELEAVRAVD
jgi:polyisoprenoid-binding protein YceI